MQNSGLSLNFVSHSGRSYIYDAIANKIYFLKHSGSNVCSKMLRRRGSPISQLKLPFTFDQLKEEIENHLSYLIINVTEQCNLRCDYCSYSGHHEYRRSHTAANMSYSTACQAIDWFYRHSRQSPDVTISYYGGEPLINRETIWKTVDYARQLFKNQRQRYQITTNGLLIDKEMGNWLANNPDVLVNVTLNGPSTLHDRFRHTADGHGSQQKIMQNLEEIHSQHRAVFARQVGVTINYLHAVDLPSIKEWYFHEPIFIEKLPIALRRIMLRFGDNELKKKFSQYIPPQQEVLSTLARLEKEYIESLRKKDYKRNFWALLWDAPLAYIHFRNMTPLQSIHLYSGGCAPLTKRTFVDVDGNLRLCEKGDGKIVLGDIYRGVEYKKLEKLVSAFEQLINKRCRFCFAIRRCSLCLNDVLGNQDNIDEKFLPMRCQDFADSFRQELALYCSIMEESTDLLDHLSLPGERLKAPC